MVSYNIYFPISVSVGRNISSYLFIYLNYVMYPPTYPLVIKKYKYSTYGPKHI